MELIFFVIGFVWIVGSYQFIKERIHTILYGLSGSKLYDNLASERPEKYGKDLSNSEKIFKIFFTVVLGIIYIFGGFFLMYIAISNLHTWLPK